MNHLIIKKLASTVAAIPDTVTQRDSDVGFGFVQASSLSRLLQKVGVPKEEVQSPSKPFDPEPANPNKPFDLRDNPRNNPKKIEISPMTPFAILTAWKVVLPPEGMTYEEAEAQGKLRKVTVAENRERNRKLAQELAEYRMGPYRLVGFWQEPPQGYSYDEAREAGNLPPAVKEESFFVIKPDNMDYNDFKGIIHDLAFPRVNPQWAYIICDGEEVWEITKGGKRSLGTKLQMSTIGQAYSRMRGYPNNPFVFAGVSTPTDLGEKREFSRNNLRWLED